MVGFTEHGDALTHYVTDEIIREVTGQESGLLKIMISSNDTVI
jgi:hypothetical protein